MNVWDHLRQFQNLHIHTDFLHIYRKFLKILLSFEEHLFQGIIRYVKRNTEGNVKEGRV